jgi:hypothetical protein
MEVQMLKQIVWGILLLNLGFNQVYGNYQTEQQPVANH